MSSPKLEFLKMLKDMPVTSDDELQLVNRLINLRSKIDTFTAENIINYEEQLREVFKVKYLERKKENLKYLLSYQSMSLYADYQNRLDVLRELKYVDNKNSVQMKGNVACEMSNHELLITELVLRNALNDLQPAEIAALLSCFVYQGKKQNEPLQLTATLENVSDLEFCLLLNTLFYFPENRLASFKSNLDINNNFIDIFFFFFGGAFKRYLMFFVRRA